MKRALPFLIVLAFHCIFTIQGAVVATTANQRSENGLFSADITSTAPNEIIIGIHRHDGDVKTFSWSKKVLWNGANATITAFPWIKRYISNDGETVVLYNQQPRSESWTWVTKNREPVRHSGYDFRQVLGWEVETSGFRSGMLQFLYEEQGVHALWFPRVNKWLTIDLKTGALRRPDSNLAEVLTTLPLNAPKTDEWVKPPSEDLVSKLNAEAVRRSLEAVRRHQPSAIKSMLKPIQEKVGSLIPGLKPSSQPRQAFLPDAYAGYIFLAHHKVPEAESYIRKLLELPFEEKNAIAIYRFSPEFTLLSQERLLGDRALRLWNKEKVDASSGPTDLHSPDFTRKSQKYLGGVAGRVQLPMVRPDSKPGAAWVYLIPAKVRPGAWRKSRDVIPLLCPLDFNPGFIGGPRLHGPPQFDAINFRFETILPGEYKLKAVWDRRPPFANQEGRAMPDPGDYESVESEPFTIKAGTSHAAPVLQCTNRVGQAENYYAADETWKNLNPRPKQPSRQFLYSGAQLSMLQRYGPLQYRDDSSHEHRWIIKSNVVTKSIEFRRADVIQVLPIGAPLERDELIITFGVQDLSDLSLRKLVPQIRDEHGCDFEATLSVPAPRPGPGEITIRAGVFPRKKEFTLALLSATDRKVICSFSIRNGGPSQLAQWRTRPLPLSRTIEGKNVRLAGLSRSAGAKFQLVDKGTATHWTPESVAYQDREGNRSFEADDFCQKENQIKIQIVQGAETREFITEFPDKR